MCKRTVLYPKGFCSFPNKKTKIHLYELTHAKNTHWIPAWVNSRWFSFSLSHHYCILCPPIYYYSIILIHSPKEKERSTLIGGELCLRKWFGVWCFTNYLSQWNEQRVITHHHVLHHHAFLHLHHFPSITWQHVITMFCMFVMQIDIKHNKKTSLWAI